MGQRPIDAGDGSKTDRRRRWVACLVFFNLTPRTAVDKGEGLLYLKQAKKKTPLTLF
jgi:hypothetical protein